MLISIFEAQQQLEDVWRGPHLVGTQNSPLMYRNGVIAPYPDFRSVALWWRRLELHLLYRQQEDFPVFFCPSLSQGRRSEAPLMLSDSLFITHVM